MHDNLISCADNEVRCLLNSVLYGKHATPFINLLMLALADAGCPVKPDIHIAIEDCSDNCGIIGAFDSYNNQIVLCKNQLNALKGKSSKISSIQETLSHELIHAYDHCRANVDFYDNKAHLMCSEIRAASLSGQCMFSENVIASTLNGFKAYHQTCVKKAALSSFQALHPSCDKRRALNLLEKLFPSCYNDYAPFDRIPFSKKQAEMSFQFYKRRRCKM